MKALFYLFAVVFIGANSQKPKYASVVEAALDTPELSTILSVLSIAGLDPILQQEFLDITVFAPTNAAIEKLLIEMGVTLDGLIQDLDTLTSLLLNHVAPVYVGTSQMMDGMQVQTLNEGVTGNLTLFIDNGSFTVESGSVEANIIKPDIFGGQGVIHIIDAVLMP